MTTNAIIFYLSKAKYSKNFMKKGISGFLLLINSTQRLQPVKKIYVTFQYLTNGLSKKQCRHCLNDAA